MTLLRRAVGSPGHLAAIACLVIGAVAACGSATSSIQRQAAGQLEAERLLLARYPRSGFVASVSCSTQGLDAARSAAREEVIRSIHLELTNALSSITKSVDHGEHAKSWSEIVNRTQTTSRFEDAALIRSEARDVLVDAGQTCAAMHLSRAEAEPRLVERWNEAFGRVAAAAARCDQAFLQQDPDAFTPAWRDARDALVDAMAACRDRLAISGLGAGEFGEAAAVRQRLSDQAGRLRGRAVFAVESVGSSPEHAAGVQAEVVKCLQGLGLQAAVGADATTSPITHRIQVRSEELCESTYVGQACRVRLSLQGGRADRDERPLQVVVMPADPAVHRTSRDIATREAYRATLTAPELAERIRDALGRILPL